MHVSNMFFIETVFVINVLLLHVEQSSLTDDKDIQRTLEKHDLPEFVMHNYNSIHFCLFLAILPPTEYSFIFVCKFH